MGFRLFYFMVCLVWIPVNAQASQACPKQIGYLDKNALTDLVLPIVQDVYQKLGCDTEFVNLPGRRGVSAFNEGRTDGELLRLRLVEERYLVPFVRAQVPLIRLKSYFWKNPSMVNDERKPYGYVKGVMWQEKYAKGKPFNAFYNTESLFKAYNAGQIAGFLASGPAIEVAGNKDVLSPAPVAVELVKEAPLYHYVAQPYQHFMDRFDRYVEVHQPLSHLSGVKHKIVKNN